MGIDNYITSIDAGEPVGICCIAPLIWHNGQLLTETFDMAALDDDTIEFNSQPYG